MSVSLVITAAGLSARFGSDKLLEEVNGVPMGIRALRLFASLAFEKKILVTVPGREYLIKEAKALGYETILNPAPEEGLSSSVKLGLKKALETGPTEGVIFAAADMPYLKAGSVEALLNEFLKEPEAIHASGVNGKPVKPVLFPCSLFRELMQITGDTGGKAVMRAHPELIRVHDADPEELRDIDRKEEMK